MNSMMAIAAGLPMPPPNHGTTSHATSPNSVTIGEMLCPSDKVSLVIGSKGTIINEISRKTNAIIRYKGRPHIVPIINRAFHPGSD